jgi:NAD(P)-dependent dehydrogenase (short-subunit alcohol dehydrogenase family)
VSGDPLTGKVVLVTGGGRGIGRAVALEAARRGARVAVLARTEGEVRQTAELARKHGGEAIALIGDVAVADDVAAAVHETETELGPVDALVANAGIVANVPVAEMDEETFDAVVDVNLKGVFLACRAVVPSMLARGAGRIVAVSSISATMGTPGLSAYCAAKWGVVGFVKALSEEVKGRGITVTCVLPGSVDTAMLAKGVPGLTPDMTPEEVASVILYLSSQAPAAVAGSAVEVFG